MVKKIIQKPFADGTMTNSAFFSMLRSALRNKSRWFLSVNKARERVKVPYIGSNKKKKWVYKCEGCFKLFDAKSINVHHLQECGTLKSFEDLPEFTKRLFCNSDELICLCENCHNKIHNKK